MFVDSTAKFFEEVNDAARNDAEEKVPEEVCGVAHAVGRQRVVLIAHACR